MAKDGKHGTGNGLAATATASSVRELFRTPGFGALQAFFSDWLNLDLTTLALILTLFGAISTGTRQLRAVAAGVYRWVTRFLTASVSIQASDRLNREVISWVGAHVLLPRDTRILAARSAPAQNDAMHYSMGSQPMAQPIQYLPTFGLTWFFHSKNLFLVRRIPDRSFQGILVTELADQYVVPPTGNEPLVVMCLGTSVTPIKKFLDTCRAFSEQQRSSFITVRASRTHHYREVWDTTFLRPLRPLESVHMDGKTKDGLVADVAHYLDPHTQAFYAARGIPYRRGYLLHGPPGTGKTSLSLALASRFGLELYTLHLPSLRRDSELERLFAALPPRCLVLLEGVDAVGAKRPPDASKENEDDDKDEEAEIPSTAASGSNGKFTLSGLLNVLDGVTSHEGRIVVMTSHCAAQLDDALVRPGRVDRTVALGKINQATAEEMFLRMYSASRHDHHHHHHHHDPASTAPTSTTIATPTVDGARKKEVKEDKEAGDLGRLARQFGERVPADTVTPAQLQGFLLRYTADEAVEAVRDVAVWVAEETRVP